MTETQFTVTVPSLGEHVTEATITRWLVKPGDTVDSGAPLVEVATDKVDTEVPSPHAGTVVTLHAAEDDVVEIGAPLVSISAISDVEIPQPPADAGGGDQSLTIGSETVPTEATPSPPPSPVAPESALTTVDGGAITVEPLPRIRQTIARRMLASLQTSAQLTTVVEVDVTAIATLRATHKAQFHQESGVKLSFLPFFAKAAVEALGQHPVVGAFVNADCTEITYHHTVNLGIAVDGPKGLMVPVIHDADRLGVVALAQQIAEGANQVRAGTIRPDALAGGTFTITNTGSRGALFDTPILNQPQSAILGTGTVVDRVVPSRDTEGAPGISVRSIVFLSLSYDHRVVDGADAARFLGTIRRRLEAGFTVEELLRDAGRAERPAIGGHQRK